MKSNYPVSYRYKYFKQIFCFLSNKKTGAGFYQFPFVLCKSNHQ